MPTWPCSAPCSTTRWKIRPPPWPGVLALSKDPALPKADQMADSLRRIVAHSPEARLVKLADRTNNLRQPPHYWPTDKKIAYRDEALVILQTLGGISPFMEQRLAEQIAGYARYF